MSDQPRFHPSAGIAIGPILFILALLAIIAAVMASGNGDFQVAGGADRITADIVAQANLIRNTINDCNMQYSLAASSATVTGSFTPTTDPYPAMPESGLVSALTCTPMTPHEGQAPSLWGAILLPPPTSGFNPWSYVNASESGGGRCIWTSPKSENPVGSATIVSGLTRAATKFNNAATYNNASEVLYDPSSSSQKFAVWITMPTGSPDSRCLP